MAVLLLLLMVCAPSAFAQIGSLPQKETLSYSVEWRLITAGKARVEWSAVSQPRPGWRANFQLDSTGLVSKLFRVDDDYTSTLNQALCAQYTQLTSREGRRERETRITFDSENRKALYNERDVASNSVVLSKETETPACVHDVVGGLFYLRTLNLEPGQSTMVPVSDGKRSVMAKVEAQQREDVKVGAGTFKAIRYELYLFNDVLYRRPAHLYVWVSDDRRRLPVQIRVRMQFTIGTITLLLDKVE